MEIKTQYGLKDLTTFRVDARARQYVCFRSEAQIVKFLAAHPMVGQPCLVLGGGSNLLFIGDYSGTLLHPCLKGIEVLAENRQTVRVKVMAGESWDDFVGHAVENGWAGVENLSLIPGHVGASAVQNIGAYGVEVKDVIESVEAVGIADGKKTTLLASQCGFGYRESHFKNRWKDQYIITAVIYRLCKQPVYTTHYPGVAREVAALGGPSLANLRQAIINIRMRKLPDPFETGNAGSFFKNPVVDASVFARLKRSFPDLPHFPQDDGRVKLPAGWLVERCGWKGKTVGRAGVYPKQALVLVNLGGAEGLEIVALSEKIRNSVLERFGIHLQREVRVVGESPLPAF